MCKIVNTSVHTGREHTPSGIQLNHCVVVVAQNTDDGHLSCYMLLLLRLLYDVLLYYISLLSICRICWGSAAEPHNKSSASIPNGLCVCASPRDDGETTSVFAAAVAADAAGRWDDDSLALVLFR